MKRWFIILPLSAIGAIVGLRHMGSSRAHASHLPTAGQPRIAQWLDDAPAALSLTFDDGLQSHADIAAPLLHEFGLRGTFYVVPGLARQHVADPPIMDPRLHYGEGALSWDEIRTIHTLGMEIGNHSLYHHFLNRITDDAQLHHEINDAADLIAKNVGEAPATIAFPYNEFSPQSRAVALERHIAIRDHWTDYGRAGFTTAVANHLVEEAIQKHGWLVPMIHGIDGGFLPLSSEVLREHLAFIKNQGERVWVDTYADVARYEQERKAATLHVEDSQPGELTLSITGRMPANPLPVTVVLPLPLNENSDDVSARVASTDEAVEVVRMPDRVLVNLPVDATVTVRWH